MHRRRMIELYMRRICRYAYQDTDTKWWKLGTAVAPGIALPSCLTRPCLLFVLPDARDIQNKYVAIMALDDIFWQKETKGCLKLFFALRLSTDWL